MALLPAMICLPFVKNVAWWATTDKLDIYSFSQLMSTTDWSLLLR